MPSRFINKVSIASTYCSVSARGMAAVGDDHKRWLLTCSVVSNFFPGFINDSIVSTPCIYLRVQPHTSLNTSPFLETALSSSEMKLQISFTCSKAGPALGHSVPIRRGF